MNTHRCIRGIIPISLRLEGKGRQWPTSGPFCFTSPPNPGKTLVTIEEEDGSSASEQGVSLEMRKSLVCRNSNFLRFKKGVNEYRDG